MSTARYDAVADFYASGWSDDADDPVTAALLDLLGPVAGERVLDVACGHGRVSRALARRGAHVVGVDLSAGLLAHAERALAEEPLDIGYIQADVSMLDSLGPDPFAAVVCSMGLSDVDDLDGCLRLVASALRPGGRFVFSILHPCFSGGGEVSGSWPTGSSYYDETWWAATGPASTLRNQVGANHRTLATYVNRLQAYGLLLDQVAEPPPSASWREQHPNAARGPVYLVARCLRSPALPS
jgi:2-polyprenyl-3-methyl-5-hydroxy-6-metoxy-1,4-benzoquinol methylase